MKIRNAKIISAAGAVMATAGLLAATACTPAAPEPTGAAPQATTSENWQEEYTKAIEPAWTTDTEISGDVSVVGDSVLVYQPDSKDQLKLVAYSAKDGSKKWEADAYPGFATALADVKPLVTQVDGQQMVAFLRPIPGSDGTWFDLAVVDPASGADFKEGKPNLVHSILPTRCSDGRPICGQGIVESIESDGNIRFAFDPVSGKFSERRDDDVATEVPAEKVRQNGIDLLFVDGKRGAIVRRDNGQDLWKAKVTDLFGSKAIPAEVGDVWLKTQDGALVIGYGVGGQDEVLKFKANEKGEKTAFTRDAGNVMLTALKADTGEIVWQRNGVRPCKGMYPSDDTVGDIATFCEWTGGTFTTSDDGFMTNAEGKVIGIDTKTGETQWEVPLGSKGSSLIDMMVSANFVSVGPNLPVNAGAGAVMVNAQTGSSVPLPKDGIYACQEYLSGYTLAYEIQGESKPADVPGRRAIQACNSDMEPTGDLTMSVGALKESGVPMVDGVQIIVTKTGLAGYKVDADR